MYNDETQLKVYSKTEIFDLYRETIIFNLTMTMMTMMHREMDVKHITTTRNTKRNNKKQKNKEKHLFSQRQVKNMVETQVLYVLLLACQIRRKRLEIRVFDIKFPLCIIVIIRLKMTASL